jgi:hypothetical protein
MSAARSDSQGLPEVLEDEAALRLMRQRFERTEDPVLQGELAAEALDHIEHQLQLTRERRRQLEGVEGTLWARRNRLERFLIHTRGIGWWRARRKLPQAQAAGQPVAQAAPSNGA